MEVTRAQVKEMKRRMRYGLELSGKGQNEVARECGASQSVASEWFDLESETLPGGKFLMRLPRVLGPPGQGLNGHWLITGEGHWHAQPTTGRKDVVFMQGVEAGARSVMVEVKAALDRAERSLTDALAGSIGRARAAFEDAEADPGAGAARRPQRNSGGSR